MWHPICLYKNVFLFGKTNDFIGETRKDETFWTGEKSLHLGIPNNRHLEGK